MPRITADLRGHRLQPPVASMRPGRNAPDNVDLVRGLMRPALASMRPGRNAPDNGGELRWPDPDEAGLQ